MARFVQELEQVDIVRFSSEVLADELENGTLQQERIVEGFESYAVRLVPRRFPMPRRDLVHDIF